MPVVSQSSKPMGVMCASATFPKSTVAANLQQYADALGNKIAKLRGEDRRIAFHALHGILAEVERVEGLETMPETVFQ